MNEEIQQYDFSCFACPSYGKLFHVRSQYRKSKIPFVIALTPLPSQLIINNIVPYSFKGNIFCRNCFAHINYGTKLREDRVSWTCNICGRKIEPTIHPNCSIQKRLPVYDAVLPKDKAIPQEIKYSTRRALFCVEYTKFSIESGLYQYAIESIKQAITNHPEINVGIIFYNTKFYFPRAKAEITRTIVIPDTDDPVFPPLYHKFSERLISYLDSLKSIPIEDKVISITQLIKAIGFLSLGNVCNFIYSHGFQIYNMDTLTNIGLGLSKNGVSFDFFTCAQNTIAINDFLMMTNSKMTHFHPQMIPSDPIAPRLYRPIITAYHSEEFSLDDIKGNGLRKTKNQFSLGTIRMDETVYFYYEYEKSQLTMPNPSFQFKVRFIDCYENIIFRFITLSLSFGQGEVEIGYKLNIDVILASSLLFSIDKAREFHSFNVFLDEIHKIKKTYTDKNSFPAKILLNQSNSNILKMNAFFSMIGSRIQEETIDQIIGASPENITLYLVPIAYRLEINSNQIPSPCFLTGFSIQYGALYIRLSNKIGILYLPNNENIETWEIATSQSPLKDIIAAIYHEKSIEIISPQTSQHHPLYNHIIACMATSIYQA